jgi:hypothetical protein
MKGKLSQQVYKAELVEGRRKGPRGMARRVESSRRGGAEKQGDATSVVFGDGLCVLGGKKKKKKGRKDIHRGKRKGNVTCLHQAEREKKRGVEHKGEIEQKSMKKRNAGTQWKDDKRKIEYVRDKGEQKKIYKKESEERRGEERIVK